MVMHPFRQGRDLPVYDLPRPLGLFKGSRHCIIYGLFVGNDDEVESDYHAYLVNSAFWAGHGWRSKSNLEDKEWDIYFFVERRLYEQPSIREQFEVANLTDSVVLFDAPQGEAIKMKFSLSMYATLHPIFDRYERVYKFDADMFLCTQDGVIFDVDKILDIGKDESLFNILAMTPSSHFRLQRPPYDLPARKAQARLRYHLEKYLGKSLGRGYRNTLGGVYAWNPQRLRDDFKDMVRVLTPDVGNDETQVAIYRRKTGFGNLSLNRIWGKESNFHLVGFHDVFMATELPYFLEHVVLGTDGEKVTEPGYNRHAFLDKWYECIGVNER